jgi:hypothetical protein
MKINELKEDSFIIDWFDTFDDRKASEKTTRNYLLGMQLYTECLQSK